ncbi:MAG: FprA family A-type flavoprotein [Elusimicrobia bacterium]|nr:FprA family A-type flavoprotein [Elusimicrobiota bacterium]
MKGPFQAVPVTDKVYWVGAVDWDIRDFHGYATSRGTTYNAYLVMADKPTLIDTVKAPFADEMLARIRSVCDPKSIRYVVSNHSEMDHSGALPQALALIQPEKVLASAMGVKALQAHFHWDVPVQAVKDGETLDLGGERLTFMETRMVHWPDSMFSYLQGAGVLFSNDGFGMHLASARRFDDETPERFVEAAKYYANILLPFSDIVLALLDKVAKSGLPLKLIAPDHGPVWRREPERIVSLWAEWARQKPRNKAVVVFDTMWGSTDKLGRAAAEGLVQAGVETLVMPLRGNHRSDVATELLEAGAILVGSPTINKQLFPTVADLLSYLKGLRRKNLTGAAFGSYGWGGESIKLAQDALTEMGVATVEPVKCQYVPDAAALDAAHALGQKVAAKLKEALR